MAYNSLESTMTQGPSATQWDMHREKIRKLYVDENKTLKDVMETMKREDGFRGTTKMYKNKVTVWGFDKKLKEVEIMAVVRKKRQRNAIGKCTDFRIRGRPLKAAQVERYLKRKHMVEDDVLSGPNSPAASDISAISFFTPQASPVPPSSPLPRPPGMRLDIFAHRSTEEFAARDGDDLGTQDPANVEDGVKAVEQHPSRTVARMLTASTSIRLSEHVFADIQAYMKGSFESGIWTSAGPTVDITNLKPWALETNRCAVGWQNLVVNACDLLQQGQMQKAGEFLRRAFVQVEDSIKSEDPYFIPYLFWVLEELGVLRKRSDIVILLLQQIYRLTCLSLGYNHPIGSITSHLLSLDIWEDVSAIAHALIHNTQERSLGPDHKAVIQLRLDAIHCSVRRNEWASAEYQYRSGVRDWERAVVKNPVMMQRALFHLADALLKQGSFAEAETIARKCSRWTVRDDEPDRARVVRRNVRSYALLSLALQQQAKFVLAEAASREACSISIANFGVDDAETLCMLAKLQDLLALLRR